MSRQSWTRANFLNRHTKGQQERARNTLQDFSRGCKNDDLKNLIDFPSEVLSHSAIKQKIYKTISTTGKTNSKWYMQ